ncbi:MAG: type II toxin-antitoxin system HicA family toxin [Cyclobacteriaceae bacterium]|nr:type II toxin-antitoxin system HicA family toxin [Cyclobacteriaceae bacterium]
MITKSTWNILDARATRAKGGHIHYTRRDLLRPLTLQSHIDPVPEFIIRNHLRILDKSRKDFLDEFFTI